MQRLPQASGRGFSGRLGCYWLRGGAGGRRAEEGRFRGVSRRASGASDWLATCRGVSFTSCRQVGRQSLQESRAASQRSPETCRPSARPVPAFSLRSACPSRHEPLQGVQVSAYGGQAVPPRGEPGPPIPFPGSWSGMTVIHLWLPARCTPCAVKTLAPPCPELSTRNRFLSIKPRVQATPSLPRGQSPELW